jgi:lysophospholipase L1-like esterase
MSDITWNNARIFIFVVKYINMKKKYIIIILSIVIIAAGIYLKLSYDRIYDEISQKNLKAPVAKLSYEFGNNAGNDKSIIYVSLGDSLTAGVGVADYEESYPYLIAEKLAVKNSIILENNSVPGFTSENVENALLPLAVSEKPDIVTLLVGINDIRDNVSKEKFQENYDQIIKTLKQETSAKIYVINIPFIGSGKLISPPYNYYFDLKTKEFNKIIEELAQKNNVQYIDLYSPTAEEYGKSDSYYSIDLFHPSAEGYAIWADIIYSKL